MSYFNPSDLPFASLDSFQIIKLFAWELPHCADSMLLNLFRLLKEKSNSALNVRSCALLLNNIASSAYASLDEKLSFSSNNDITLLTLNINSVSKNVETFITTVSNNIYEIWRNRIYRNQTWTRFCQSVTHFII